MLLEQTIYLVFGIVLGIVTYIQNRKIKRLESRINTLLKLTENDKDERLVYLRKNLAHLNKVKAIKALRERYPELGLVNANDLCKNWMDQPHHNLKRSEIFFVI